MLEEDSTLLGGSSVQVDQLLQGLASPSCFPTPSQTPQLPESPSESEQVASMASEKEESEGQVSKRRKYQRGGQRSRNAEKMAELRAKRRFPQSVQEALGTVTASVEHALTTIRAAVIKIEDDNITRQLNDIANTLPLGPEHTEEPTSMSDTEIVGNMQALLDSALCGSSFESWKIASIATCKVNNDSFMELPVNVRTTILQMFVPVAPVIVSMWPGDSTVIAHTQYGRGDARMRAAMIIEARGRMCLPKSDFVLNAGDMLVVKSPVLVKFRALTDARFWRVIVTADGRDESMRKVNDKDVSFRMFIDK